MTRSSQARTRQATPSLRPRGKARAELAGWLCWYFDRCADVCGEPAVRRMLSTQQSFESLQVQHVP